MKVGITYDLRDEYLQRGYGEEETAEFESIETIDLIDAALVFLGHQTERIGNIEQLTTRLAADDRWDLVFNIAEGLHGFAREAQVPALLDAFEIPYTFSDALTLAVGLHKGTTKHIVRDLGIPTPDFVVLRSESDLSDVRLPFPLFVKPVAGGSSMGVSAASKVGSMEELKTACRRLLKDFRQPVLAETFLPGREFTVGIVGTGDRAESLGAMEVFLTERAEPEVYSYSNKQNYVGRVRYDLALDDAARTAEALALRVWRGLGCRDAGRLDFRCDASGRVHFMEINALAGLHPIHSDIVLLCGMKDIPYAELIRRIVASASERIRRIGRSV